MFKGELTFPIDDRMTRLVDILDVGGGAVLVKDQGVYLHARVKGHDEKVTIYANGLNPEVDDFDDWWETARAICGGDDFAEPLDTEFFREVVDTPARRLVIGVYETHFKFEARI